MAEQNFNMAVAFGVQSVAGTANATIAALSGALDSSDGIVLGDPESGIGESGIDFAVSRSLREKADVSGSFTKQPSDYLREALETFQVAVPLKGNGATATPAAGEAKPLPGIDALFQSGGLGGANGTAPKYVYTPANAQIVTAKVWISGLAWVVRDLITSQLQIQFTPGGIAVATFTLGGVVDSFAEEAFPTFDYGTQASLSAPSVEEVGHNWGISAALRGFSEATLTIDNETEDVPDSNAAGGIRTRQTGRTIGFAGTIYADDGDLDYERAELVRTNAPTDPQVWTVGTPAGAADTINAFTPRLETPEVRSLTPDKLGVAHASSVELVAVNLSANNEFSLTFE